MERTREQNGVEFPVREARPFRYTRVDTSRPGRIDQRRIHIDRDDLQPVTAKAFGKGAVATADFQDIFRLRRQRGAYEVSGIGCRAVAHSHSAKAWSTSR